MLQTVQDRGTLNCGVNDAVPGFGFTDADGNFSVTVIREELLGLYYKQGVSIADINNVLLYFFQEVESPARLAGNILLVLLVGSAATLPILRQGSITCFSRVVYHKTKFTKIFLRINRLNFSLGFSHYSIKSSVVFSTAQF